MPANELCFLTARDLAARIRSRDISCREVMEAHIAQIDRVNPLVNAIVTYAPEQAMERAGAADDALARGETVGPLHGLPTAHKDLVETKGMRTTLGSPVFADNVPLVDAVIVERMRDAGAISLGKTNTPEFGAGSQTFNPVFGATLNPYDTSKTCGGSSGGAAVSVATGMLPIADGSDVGGSLRNPGSWNNVVGFRSSPGRVPNWPSLKLWPGLPVNGPIARTVADTALLFSALAGPDPRDPGTFETPGATFAASLERDFRGVRIAWSRDLGGLPIDASVLAVLEPHRKTLASLGCEVEDAEPDFTGADEAFEILRAAAMANPRNAGLIANHRSRVKETVIWNTEQGMALGGVDIGRGEALRANYFHAVRTFFDRYDFLAAPVTQVPPFDVTQEYPLEVAGQPMHTYIEWMRACTRISISACPAISVPAGFTAEGLPVGIQLISRNRNDFGVLQLAHAFESATGYWKQHPKLAM